MSWGALCARPTHVCVCQQGPQLLQTLIDARSSLLLNQRFPCLQKITLHSLTEKNKLSWEYNYQSLPLTPSGMIHTRSPAWQERCCQVCAKSLYLSVRPLNAVVGLVTVHIQSGVAGPSRGSHVCRIAAFVASTTTAVFFLCRIVSEGAAGNRLPEETPKKKKNRQTHRRVEAPCVYCAILRDVLLALSGCC